MTCTTVWALGLSLLLSSAISQRGPSRSVLETVVKQYGIIHEGLALDSMEKVNHAASAMSAVLRKAGHSKTAGIAARIAATQELAPAREAFGELSETLVPWFIEARLEGLHGYICPMNRKKWIQREAEASNPYYGPSMKTCAVRLDKQADRGK